MCSCKITESPGFEITSSTQKEGRNQHSSKVQKSLTEFNSTERKLAQNLHV